jgi:hypothetical protein
MSEPACPSCGETEALQARPSEGDNRITCKRCGAARIRGEARCKRCGGAGGLTGPQHVTRHDAGLPAGESVRPVLLCISCDGDAIAAMLGGNQPVPEGYVSRFLFGDVDHATDAGSASARRAAQTRHTAASEPASVVTREPAPPDEAPTTPADPTVRQAIESFLDMDPVGVETMVLVLLGAKLGASRRLSQLNAKELADVLTTWVDHTWAPQTSQRAASTATIRSAFAYWRGQGWLQDDPSEGLQ